MVCNVCYNSSEHENNTQDQLSKIWKVLMNCAIMGEFRYTTPLAPNGSTRLFDVPPIISHVITFLSWNCQQKSALGFDLKALKDS